MRIRIPAVLAAVLSLAAPAVALADDGPQHRRWDDRFERAIERHYARTLNFDHGWSFYYDASIRKCNATKRPGKVALCATNVLVERRDAADNIVDSCTDSVRGYIPRHGKARVTRVRVSCED